MRARRYLAIPALAALLAVGVAAGSGDSKSPTRSVAPVDPTAEAEHYVAVQRWNAAVLWNQTMAWNAAVYWGQIQSLADHYVPPTPPRVTSPRRSVAPTIPVSTVGGACGGATNGADAYIGRESGGNPNARNASGAWGCYQIMPGTWASSCSDLGPHGSASTEAQAACASRLPSSAWAASGG